MIVIDDLIDDNQSVIEIYQHSPSVKKENGSLNTSLFN
uniref:Uncharacterized protein n=1 Tax=Tetranychus urticae TaxID=32264 RepID=T1KA29_TETUR